MEEKDLEILQSKLDENIELANLWQEHQALEKRLEEMNQRVYLTPEEQVERKQMQKVKLAGRDRIEEILSEYRSE